MSIESVGLVQECCPQLLHIGTSRIKSNKRKRNITGRETGTRFKKGTEGQINSSGLVSPKSLLPETVKELLCKPIIHPLPLITLSKEVNNNTNNIS